MMLLVRTKVLLHTIFMTQHYPLNNREVICQKEICKSNVLLSATKIPLAHTYLLQSASMLESVCR